MKFNFSRKDNFSSAVNDYKHALITFVVGITATIFLFTVHIRNNSSVLQKQFYKDSKKELYLLQEKLEFINAKIALIEELYSLSRKLGKRNDIFQEQYKYIYYFESYSESNKSHDVVIHKKFADKNFRNFFRNHTFKSSYFFEKNGKKLLFLKKRYKSHLNFFVVDIDNLLERKIIKFENKSIYVFEQNNRNKDILDLIPSNYFKLVPYHLKKEVDLFGSSYQVIFFPNVASATQVFNSFSFYVLFGGVFLTVICSIFLFKIINNEREIREANRSLSLNQNILKIFVDYSPVQLAMLDKNNIFILCNQKWLESIDADIKVEGKDIFELSPELIKTNFSQDLKKALAEDVASYGVDRYTGPADKKKVWFKYAIVPWKDPNSTSYGSIVFVENVTELYEKQNQLKETVSRLKLANANMDDMLHIASHDLKEPLRGINLNIEILQEDFQSIFTGDSGKRLNRIKDLSSRLTNIITSISQYSKIGNEEVEFEKIDIRTLIEGVKQSLSEFLHENNAVIEIEGDMPQDLLFNKVSLQQIFYNLIINGVIYNSKKERFVKIKHKYYNDKHEFVVQDNGDGIKKEFYTSIFRMFKRLDKKKSGTGAGLAFVKKRIERYGGKISINSKVEIGSAFSFTILRELKNEDV